MRSYAYLFDERWTASCMWRGRQHNKPKKRNLVLFGRKKGDGPTGTRSRDVEIVGTILKDGGGGHSLQNHKNAPLPGSIRGNGPARPAAHQRLCRVKIARLGSLALFGTQCRLASFGAPRRRRWLLSRLVFARFRPPLPPHLLLAHLLALPVTKQPLLEGIRNLGSHPWLNNSCMSLRMQSASAFTRSKHPTRKIHPRDAERESVIISAGGGNAG